jgi:hypothetical protein
MSEKNQQEIEKRANEIQSAFEVLSNSGFCISGTIHALEIIKAFSSDLCPGCALKAADSVMEEERDYIFQKIIEKLDNMKDENLVC